MVISASHNPFGDNGVKFFSAAGEKLPDDWEIAVEARSPGQPAQWADSAALGKARRLDDAAGRYLEFCKSTFAQDLSLKGLKIVVDGAHGAAYSVAPKVFHELGAEVVPIGCSPRRVQHQRRVRRDVSRGALPGRCASRRPTTASPSTATPTDCRWWTPKSTCYDGDELLYAVVSDRPRAWPCRARRSRHADDQHGDRAGPSGRGVALVRARSATATCWKALIARGWRLGGENSGHLLMLDRHTTGDGIVSALQVLQAVRRSGKPLAGLLDGLRLFPQELINVRVAAPGRLEVQSGAGAGGGARRGGRSVTPDAC